MSEITFKGIFTRSGRSTVFKLALALAILPCSFSSALAETGKHEASAAEHTGKRVCHVSCTDPHAACEESQKVIDTLNHLCKSLSEGDFDTVSQYLSEDVTTVDDKTNKTIFGRDAVLADMKQKYEKSLEATDGGSITYTIEQPYAKVTGKYATVTFLARKTLSGKNPVSYESHSTDVFVKEGDKWKKLHYRGAWKKISS